MSFKGKTHSEETKRKIALSRKKYTGKNHPRFGAEWTDEQRAKYILTMHHLKEEDKKVKMFLIKYDSLFRKFKNQ
jgi:translation initiation factor 2 alpha subunit (eIF-2alpha)